MLYAEIKTYVFLQVLSHVVARNLASHIDSSKPILFNLALKEKSPTAVKEFSKLLSDCKCW